MRKNTRYSALNIPWVSPYVYTRCFKEYIIILLPLSRITTSGYAQPNPELLLSVVFDDTVKYDGCRWRLPLYPSLTLSIFSRIIEPLPSRYPRFSSGTIVVTYLMLLRHLTWLFRLSRCPRRLTPRSKPARDLTNIQQRTDY